MTNLKERAARASRSLKHRVGGHVEWRRNGYSMPAPQWVKWSVLRRLGQPGDVWVETGTYLGDTTDFLAQEARHVFSIEPQPELAERARRRFADNDRVTIVEGSSEDRLPDVLEQLAGGPLSLWLDGHYSAGITYQGEIDTPIREELSQISKHLDRLGPVTVLVDDIRLFDPTNPAFAAYPSRGWLVSWAEQHGLTWTIEHDIFAASP